MRMRDGKVIKSYYEDYKPLERRRNGIKLAGWVNETKSGQSVEFSETYNDEAEVIVEGNTVQREDTLEVVSVEGKKVKSRNTDGSKSSECNIPTLRKINTIADTFNTKTGLHRKKISDWVTLDGSINWGLSIYPRNGYKLFVADQYNDGVTFGAQAYKYDSTMLIPETILRDPISADKFLYQPSIAYETRVGVSNIDSGMSDAYVPTSNEIKSYFYGWKMCHSDGVSPYYKSEIPYTPTTWAEWTKAVEIIGDSTGLEWLSLGTGSYPTASIDTSLNNSTKYAILFTVVFNNITDRLYMSSNLAGSTIFLCKAGVTGNIKAVFISQTSIIENKLKLVIPGNSASGTKIKINNIRLLELPAGSQIESDFNTLTADELSIKYKFYGLYEKYWKHVTDGEGLTNVLPTASYEGYTPYKMIYELAEPVETILTPTPIETYYPETIIETDAEGYCKPNLTATAKIMEAI